MFMFGVCLGAERERVGGGAGLRFGIPALASVSVARRWMLVVCRDPPFFRFYFGLNDTENV